MQFREDDKVKVINAPPYLNEGGNVLGSSADGETVFVRFDVAMPVELLYRPETVKQAYERIGEDSLQCSFCNKTQREVSELVQGPRGYICNECVDICVEIINETAAVQSGAAA